MSVKIKCVTEGEFKLTKSLSDVPHKMMEQAVEDYIAITKNPKYEVNMDTWFGDNLVSVAVRDYDVCNVCLAGSVLACRSNLTPQRFDVDKLLNNSAANKRLYSKLMAINSFRQGSLRVGLIKLGYTPDKIKKSGIPDNITVCDDPNGCEDNDCEENFISSMKVVSLVLKACGF